MKLNETQQNMVARLREMINTREKPTEIFVGELCKAFDGHVLTSFYGIGGTRIVIAHPSMDMVLKIAFTEEGIIGNRDEHNAYRNAPRNLRAHLGEVGDILEDGMILEMKYYEPMKEEEFEDYEEQLEELLEMIDFVHYQDPPYFHSFGVSEEGQLVLIDYGETEQFRVK